jgi:hypothetical protein
MASKRIELDELVGLQVRSAGIRGGVEIIIGSHPEHVLRIESPFKVIDSSGEAVVHWNSEEPNDIDGLSKVGSTLGSSVTEGVAAAGVLQLTLSNGVSVSAPPDEKYEAWTLTGPKGVLVLPPGGS